MTGKSRTVEEREECLRRLEEAAEAISRAGFVASMTAAGELYSVFAVEDSPLFYAFTAKCENGRVRVHAGIKGVRKALESLAPERRVAVLEKILEVPARYSVSIGLDGDTLLVVLDGDGMNQRDFTLNAYAFTVRLAGWLSEQIERAGRGEGLEDFEY